MESWWWRWSRAAVGIVLGASLVACSTSRHARDPLADALATRRLMVPVEGIAPHEVPDTFHAARDGGTRTHRASDIMAPEGTPVVSADDGRVFKLGRNRRGGLTIYATDPERRFLYYYAHLRAYREGLREGMPLSRGMVIGYVGHTGNASADAPHCHFQVTTFQPTRWWEGHAIDARPCFVVEGSARN